MQYSLDVNFINPFLEGTIQTLKVQCSLEANPGRPFIKNKSERTMVTDIAGVIGITSDQFKGSISIGFPEGTFLGVMGNMLGEKCSEITPELEDGAGELINIIFGAAKRVLNEKGYTIQKALPSVISGMGLKVRHLTVAPTLVLPFNTPIGPFQVEVSIETVAQ